MLSHKFRQYTHRYTNGRYTGGRFLKIFGMIAAVILTGSVLSGCSVQPLYGPTAGGGQVVEELKAIKISSIPGRVGQRVRNELIYQVTNGGSPLPSLYRLDIAVREVDTATLVTRSGDSQGQMFQLDATFTLVRLKDNKVMFEGKSHARAAYDKSFLETQPAAGQDPKQVNSIYGNIRARVDAENRAARTMAEEMKIRLAAFLSSAS